MEKSFLRKQYHQGAVLLKQFEATPKKELLSGKASTYMNTMQHISTIQDKIRNILRYTTDRAEEEFINQTPKVTEREKQLQSDIDIILSLIEEGEKTIEHFENEIEKCTVEYDTITQKLAGKRDDLRNLIGQQGYSTEEASDLLHEVQKLEKSQKSQKMLINKHNSEIEKTRISINDLSNELKNHQSSIDIERNQKNTFDRHTYEKRLMDVFVAWYDSRPKQSYRNYKSLYELFGVEAIINENELLQEVSRGEKKRGKRGQAINKKLTFKKLGGLKEILDSMGIAVQPNNIYEFKDVTYIYIPEWNKGVIISDKKHSATDRECYTHATFIMPGEATKNGQKQLLFPTPLLAKKIIFLHEEQWKIDISNWLQEDNHHEGFKTRVWTYNEDKGIRIKGLVEKPNVVGENIVEKNTCIEILQSHFTDLNELGHESYKEFATSWNNNPDNKFKLKGSLAGLRFVLGGTKPVFTLEYIKALILQDSALIKRIENDYEKSKITVYNNQETYETFKELVINNILTTDAVGFYKYRDVLVNNICTYMVQKHALQIPSTLKEKRKILIKYTGLTSMPMKLSVMLGGVESADSTYQSLLVKKFIASIKGGSLSSNDELALQEREIFVLSHLGKPEKNIFKKAEDISNGTNPSTIGDNGSTQEPIVVADHIEPVSQSNETHVSHDNNDALQSTIEDNASSNSIDYRKEIDAINPKIKETISLLVQRFSKRNMNINNKYLNYKEISSAEQTLIMEFAYIYLKKELKKSCDRPKTYVEDFLRNQSAIMNAFNKSMLLEEKPIGISTFDRFEVIILTNELMHGISNKWF